MPRVLIVDDDRITVSLLQTLLELDGFEVELAPDSASGRQKTEETKPDAFLVDFNLSDGDGTDFVSWVRQHEGFKKAPIIMASGMERSTMAREAGANHFLIKPYDPGELVDILNELLAS